MEKYILVAHRDESNPNAVETVARFRSRRKRNGAMTYIVLVNVPKRCQIALGLEQVKQHIQQGRATATTEASQMVCKLARISADKQHRLGVTTELVNKVSGILRMPLTENEILHVCE